MVTWVHWTNGALMPGDYMACVLISPICDRSGFQSLVAMILLEPVEHPAQDAPPPPSRIPCSSGARRDRGVLFTVRRDIPEFIDLVSNGPCLIGICKGEPYVDGKRV